MTQSTKRLGWSIWMQVAGIAYAVSLLIFVTALAWGTSIGAEIATMGVIVLIIATLAFVGGWSRYMDTKRA